MMRSVFDIEDKRMDDINLVGGKASSLAVLNRIPDIQVPPAIVITTLAYNEFLKANPEIVNQIEFLKQLINQKQIESQAQTIQMSMCSTAIPEFLGDEIVKAYQHFSSSIGEPAALVSVRSSATAEDMPSASFAGQYETYLNQRGKEAMLDSVRKVWASTYTVRAVNYRNARSIKHSSAQMAVIIQQMVNAHVAGTAFTVDLETGMPMISINATYGLGEADVGGLVTSDRWVVEPQTMTVIKRRLGNKIQKIFYNPETGTNVSQKTTDEEKAKYAIDSSTVSELAKRVKAIGTYYQENRGVAYVDTEFAINQQKTIFFVQARPETVWAQGKTLVAVNLSKAKDMQRVFEGGITGASGVVTGKVRVVTLVKEAEDRVLLGDILVAPNTTNIWEPVLGRAGGAITDIGGTGSHTAIVMREQGKPALVGTQHATRIFKAHDNQEVTLDATQKIVFLGKVSEERFFTPSSLHPTYGTLDQETEEQSWDGATKTKQTYVDSHSRRWIGKPNYRVSKFMQEIYSACHNQVGDWLGAPVKSEIQNGVHRVDFHDIFQWRLKLREMKLEELEMLHRKRIETVRTYLLASEQFALTPDAVSEWLEQYILMNAFMGVAYDIHKVTEGWLENELACKQIPEPYYSQVRSSMGALIGETETTLALRDYKNLLDTAQKNEQLNKKFQSVENTGILKMIGQINPEFYTKLQDYAFRYKITKETDPTLSPKEPLLEVLSRLNTDLAQRRQISITRATPEEFYPEDERFGRIVRLTLESEQARQDAHHQKIRGQWLMHKKLQPWVEEVLVKSGKLSSYEELFNYSPDWLLRQVIRYQMENWLGGFLGQAVDVSPVPESMSFEAYRRLKSLGFELFYLPALEVISAEAISQYPNWKYPLADRYWTTDIVEQQPLLGQWVAVEMVEKPSIQGTAYEKDHLMPVIGVETRFLSWDEIHENILPKIAEFLDLELSCVKLPHAIEWNFIGNFLRYLREKGEKFADWGNTVSWEWTQSKYGRYHRLLVGKHGAEGLDGLSAVGWVFSGDEWYRIFGFRTLIVIR